MMALHGLVARGAKGVVSEQFIENLNFRDAGS
jgi:hypothetical protein